MKMHLRALSLLLVVVQMRGKINISHIYLLSPHQNCSGHHVGSGLYSGRIASGGHPDVHEQLANFLGID